ncbi:MULTISPECIES: ArnT family glycosyltransferase [Bacillus]|uniref:Glycosyltransferase family 39 protein n=1 Tax=Bacillus pseudomycoides TaxID=64104 RepID=A0AAJ3R970_9BACI|nr:MULTISPECIES: glycosyltransferase family 39 protein [Bacillus]MBD5795422.1 4-amino-4-deoxy-L-arabinose transferase [Bacillus pseudomycoides]MCR8859727.1 glycosyltransferase family 39 protein [Bacillus pseudomycoides]MDR4327696.1 glycosyltransferase family 39 protein [Bacillus pseudomycoides]MED1473642.1 glycosyltransferase family 39 protein [Bacillus pseudomycoides]MED1537593.1 glycosyltransferase family 39 protein [Bacillus pseudomycoides]
MFKKYIEKPYFLPLLVVLFLGFLLRWTVLVKYGVDLNIVSDDLGYQTSAKNLLESGMLTYHNADQPTIHIMPGQSFLLAAIFGIFGKAKLGLFVAKMTMISFGVLSIYMTFRIGKYIFNPTVGLIGAFLLAIYPPEIVIDNLTLTESPFLFLSLALLYWSLKLADSHSMKDFLLLLLFYFLALFFRVQIAIYPIFLFGYLLIKRYPFKIMMKQLLVSIVALFLVLGPWWVRNYIQFDKFIPLTAGSGNPLLLGTYQGEGYPGGKSIEEIEKEIFSEYPDIQAHQWMEMEQKIAVERMKTWWETDKTSMLKSYLLLKPQIFWDTPYYYPYHQISIFGIDGKDMRVIYDYIKVIFLVCTIITFLLAPSKWRECTFLLALIVLQTYFNTLYFAYNRYALPLMPFLFIMIGMGITTSFMAIRNIGKNVLSK